MIKASRPWLVAVAFAGSAVLGGPLLVMWGLVVGYGSLMLHSPGGGSGIYAVAGGFSGKAVIVVMLLCGGIGATVAHLRLKR